MNIKNDFSLKMFNTFGIDVKATIFLEYKTEEELKEAVLNNDAYLFHIGEGSNLLFTKDFKGTILHSCINSIEVVEQDANTVLIKVGAGLVWDDLVKYCLENGFYGLENLSFIPGEVGASAIQNIGAYGDEIEQFIEKVDLVDLKNAESRTILHDDCHYAYRDSIFKRKYKNKYAVTYVYYKLRRQFIPNLSYRVLKEAFKGDNLKKITADDVRKKVISIRNEKLPDPKILGNGGSFFKNTIVEKTHFLSLQSEYPHIPYYIVAEGYKIPTAWFIENCGWKGKRLGDAGVCTTQALILVNYGKATGKEIKHLSNLITVDVKKKFDVDILPEINIL